MGRASVPTPAVYPAFFFVLEKGSKSAGNAVIPTFPAHCPHGLQHLRHKRRNVRFEGLRRVHTCLRQQDRTQGLTRRNRGRFGWGRYYYPRSVPHVSETLRGRGLKRQTLPLLGLGRGCSQRTQRAFGTAMRLCASLSRRCRGPAGLRDLFRFCRNRDLYIRRSWFSACARHGWYHYPRRAPRVVETLDGRLPKGFICRFLRLPSSTPCAVTFSANMQISLSAISVANTFALWYDKSQIRIFRR